MQHLPQGTVDVFSLGTLLRAANTSLDDETDSPRSGHGSEHGESFRDEGVILNVDYSYSNSRCIHFYWLLLRLAGFGVSLWVPPSLPLLCAPPLCLSNLIFLSRVTVDALAPMLLSFVLLLASVLLSCTCFLICCSYIAVSVIMLLSHCWLFFLLSSPVCL